MVERSCVHSFVGGLIERLRIEWVKTRSSPLTPVYAMAEQATDWNLGRRFHEWRDEESAILNRLEEIESQHGFIPREISDELTRLLELKLERLQRIQSKVESTAHRDVMKHIGKWRGEEGNLIMILHALQDEYGYVPREVAMELSRELGVRLARIYEVITFYHYFKLVPPGRHNIAMCMGTACYLKGGEGVLEEFKRQLKVEEGETTEDRMFHLEAVRCIGCCGLAPAVVVDGRTYGKIKSSDVAGIIAAVRAKDEESGAQDGSRSSGESRKPQTPALNLA